MIVQTRDERGNRSQAAVDDQAFSFRIRHGPPLVRSAFSMQNSTGRQTSVLIWYGISTMTKVDRKAAQLRLRLEGLNVLFKPLPMTERPAHRKVYGSNDIIDVKACSDHFSGNMLERDRK